MYVWANVDSQPGGKKVNKMYMHCCLYGFSSWIGFLINTASTRVSRYRADHHFCKRKKLRLWEVKQYIQISPSDRPRIQNPRADCKAGDYLNPWPWENPATGHCVHQTVPFPYTCPFKNFKKAELTTKWNLRITCNEVLVAGGMPRQKDVPVLMKFCLLWWRGKTTISFRNWTEVSIVLFGKYRAEHIHNRYKPPGLCDSSC